MTTGIMPPQPPQVMFKQGDRVLHARRPEWGDGLVRQATAIAHDGKDAQRLIVDFPNKGRVTINTAIASLQAKEGNTTMSSSTTFPTRGFKSASTRNFDDLSNGSGSGANSGGGSGGTSGGGWLDRLAGNNNGHMSELWAMPASFNDVFASWGDRLKAVLATYRYGTDPRHARNILDWACEQTGLADPLTKYSRSELEHAFPRYIRDRDNYLFDMCRTLKRENRMDVIREVRAQCKLPAAMSMLDKAGR